MRLSGQVAGESARHVATRPSGAYTPPRSLAFKDERAYGGRRLLAMTV
jgi:hypothetical protein